LAIAARRSADNLLENTIEMRERLKADIVGDFADTAIAIKEQRLRFLDPNPCKIIGER